MRKWCPEPLDNAPEQTGGPEWLPLPFFGESATFADVPADSGTVGPVFETDPSLAGNHSPWKLLSQEDKERLLTEIRAELEKEYESKAADRQLEHQAEIEEIRSGFTRSLETWTGHLEAALDQRWTNLAAEAVGLALVLAGKVIRKHVDTERDFLARTMETALYKIENAQPVMVTVHPDDARFLHEHPELVQRFRIGEVIPDRRVEKGGCRIQSGAREWDATIEGQLTALREVIEESWAAHETPQARERGGGHDPYLD
jgi:flagellar assembly protein FliH